MPEIEGQDGEPLDPYMTGFMVGMGETGLGGADPLFATTKNIELYGGPGLGFGASGKGTQATVEEYVPGAAQAAPFVETYLDPGGIQGKAASTDFDIGMLQLDPALAPDPGPTPVFDMHYTRPPQADYSQPIAPPQPMAPTAGRLYVDPAFAPDPGPTPTFGRHLAMNPQATGYMPPPQIDYSAQQSLPQPPPLMSLPQPMDPSLEVPYIPDDYEVDQFGNPIDRRWR